MVGGCTRDSLIVDWDSPIASEDEAVNAATFLQSLIAAALTHAVDNAELGCYVDPFVVKKYIGAGHWSHGVTI